jgi:glycerol dehydrogenase-like iron-containing ADH family enzyme
MRLDPHGFKIVFSTSFGFVVSGMGDVLSIFSEAKSCKFETKAT